MISFIKGKIVVKEPTKLVVEVNDIGYNINIAISTYDTIGNIGDKVCILTYLHVKEDILSLYGFSTEEERNLFKQLISISGIGPRISLNILSHIKIEIFKQAIVTHNVEILNKTPGIGKKMAEKLILELKDKISLSNLSTQEKIESNKEDMINNAISALISLGYNKKTSTEKVMSVVKTLKDSFSLEKLVKESLKG
ncbi:MAG: Holliday junction branch migration protein RuvA [bacterium]